MPNRRSKSKNVLFAKQTENTTTQFKMLPNYFVTKLVSCTKCLLHLGGRSNSQLLSGRGTVAQSVERLSKGPGVVQLTDVGSNPGHDIRLRKKS